MRIYIDNFRGFSDTYLPISDVNFFVGENSTGKSSLLGLIYLLSNPRFWFEHSFDVGDVRFGHFDDMVSVYSSDRSYFTIGFTAEQHLSQPNRRQPYGHLLKFREHEGAPVLSEFLYFDGKTAITVVSRNEQKGSHQYHYNFRELKGVGTEDALVRRVVAPFLKGKHLTDDRTEWIALEQENPRFKLRSGARMPGRPLVTSIMEIMVDISFDIRERTNERLDIGIMMPELFNDEVAWVAPIRTKPRRTYDEYKYEFTPEGEHTPYLIKRILSTRKAAVRFQRFLKAVGKESGLFESIKVNNYGRSSTSPFELDVVLNKKTLSVSNVGYGVSQALPVIVEAFAREEGSSIAIQQPEVHLHPKAQAALGDLLFELSGSEQKRFFVETHSDYLIDRYRIATRRSKKSTKPKSQVIFFERTTSGNKLHALPIDLHGNLPAKQPKKYRDFFIREEFKLLGF